MDSREKFRPSNLGFVSYKEGRVKSVSNEGRRISIADCLVRRRVQLPPSPDAEP